MKLRAHPLTLDQFLIALEEFLPRATIYALMAEIMSVHRHGATVEKVVSVCARAGLVTVEMQLIAMNMEDELS